MEIANIISTGPQKKRSASDAGLGADRDRLLLCNKRVRCEKQDAIKFGIWSDLRSAVVTTSVFNKKRKASQGNISLYERKRMCFEEERVHYKSLQTIECEEEIYYACFNNDDHYSVILPSSCKEGCVWNFDELKDCIAEIDTPIQKTIKVVAFCFSSDGCYLAMALSDTTVKIFVRTRDGQWKENKIIKFSDNVRCVRFSDNTHYLAVALFNNNTAKMITLTEGEERNEQMIGDHDDNIEHVCFSLNALYLITTSWDKTAQIWKFNGINEWEKKDTVHHVNDVSYACFSDDSRYLVTVSRDCTAKIFMLDESNERWQEQKTIEHRDIVNEACFSHKGHSIATASFDGTVKILTRNQYGKWEVQGDIVHENKECARSVYFTPNDDFIVVLFVNDIIICRLDENGKQQEKMTIKNDKIINNISFSFDGRYLMVVSGSRINIYEICAKEYIFLTNV